MKLNEMKCQNVELESYWQTWLELSWVDGEKFFFSFQLLSVWVCALPCRTESRRRSTTTQQYSTNAVTVRIAICIRLYERKMRNAIRNDGRTEYCDDEANWMQMKIDDWK